MLVLRLIAAALATAHAVATPASTPAAMPPAIASLVEAAAIAILPIAAVLPIATILSVVAILILVLKARSLETLVSGGRAGIAAGMASVGRRSWTLVASRGRRLCACGVARIAVVRERQRRLLRCGDVACLVGGVVGGGRLAARPTRAWASRSAAAARRVSAFGVARCFGWGARLRW
jgi:hypothetical protein